MAGNGARLNPKDSPDAVVSTLTYVRGLALAKVAERTEKLRTVWTPDRRNVTYRIMRSERDAWMSIANRMTADIEYVEQCAGALLQDE